MLPLTCDTRDRKPLNDFVRHISYEGTCVVAAHQYLKAKGMPGFINNKGLPQVQDRKYLAELGNAVIQYTNTFYKA